MITHSYEETLDFGSRFAKLLKHGDIVILDGNLGAGKTAFASGVAHGLGVDDYVTSPTFTLMNVYDCADGGTMNHFDLYRMKDECDVIEAGFDEVFDSDAICLIEWAGAAEKLLNKKPITVKIRPIGENERDVQIEFPDDRKVEML